MKPEEILNLSKEKEKKQTNYKNPPTLSDPRTFAAPFFFIAQLFSSFVRLFAFTPGFPIRPSSEDEEMSARRGKREP